MAGVTIKEDFTIAAREVDFVSRFGTNWQALRDILGISRVVRKAPGTVLKAKYAELALESGSVSEGAQIPYSEALVKEKTIGTIAIKKYAKAVSLEAIEAYGYDAAVNLTDKQFLFEITSEIVGAFYDYIADGELTDTQATFQMALAMANGNVRNKWKAMRKGITNIVGFCNVLDAYAYLGAANITVQSQFGMDYIENFMGYSKLFLTSDVESGTVIATPVENLILYYVDPADSDFAKAGLEYRTDGESNLIGYHINGNYGTAVSESFAITGMVLAAEYIDGICVETIDENP